MKVTRITQLFILFAILLVRTVAFSQSQGYEDLRNKLIQLDANFFWLEQRSIYEPDSVSYYDFFKIISECDAIIHSYEKRDDLLGKTHALRGRLYDAIDIPRKAINDLNVAISINEDDESLYFDRGMVKFEIMEYQGAIQDFTNTIEIVNRKESYYYEYLHLSYYNRALAKLNIGDIDGACNDLKLADESCELCSTELIKQLKFNFQEFCE